MNDQQQAIIDDRSSPVIVALACPGSGKTATLVARVIECSKYYDPYNFIIISYTNAAATELTERIKSKAPDLKVGYIGTLHGYIMRVIMKHGKLIGLPSGFTLIDEDQQADILAGIIKQHGYKGSKKDVKEAVSRSVYLNAKIETAAERVASDYHQQMRGSATFDFDSLLIYGSMVFDNAVTHLFADEIQDSSEADFKIYESMPAAHKFFIGDPRQAIFGFRGGDVKQVQALAVNKDVKTYSLALNYRSGRRICRAANLLIGRNPGAGEDMSAAQDFDGEIELFESPNSISSLQGIALDIRDQPLGTTAAVLCRYNIHVDEAVKYFQSQNIPLARRDDVINPPDWKKARALLAVLSNPYNEVTARHYLRVAYPTRDVEIINRAATEMQSINDSYFRFQEICGSEMSQFAILTSALRSEGIGEQSVGKIVDTWEQLANKSIGDLIHALSNDAARTMRGQGVVITTFHGSKGLEFDTVYISAAEQALTPGTKDGPAMQEERRLFYVAATRTRRRLVIAWATHRAPAFGGQRAVEQRPSEFIREMGL